MHSKDWNYQAKFKFVFFCGRPELLFEVGEEKRKMKEKDAKVDF